MLIVILFFIIMPILGVIAIQNGDWDWAFLWFFPIIAMFIFGIVTLIERYKDRRWAAVCTMYNLPKRDMRPEDIGGELLHRGFRTIIDDAIKQTTDSDKQRDLQDCRRTVLNTLDNKYGDTDLGNIRCAFRYTGCHIRIEDTDGNIIKEII